MCEQAQRKTIYFRFDHSALEHHIVIEFDYAKNNRPIDRILLLHRVYFKKTLINLKIQSHKILLLSLKIKVVTSETYTLMRIANTPF